MIWAHRPRGKPHLLAGAVQPLQLQLLRGLGIARLEVQAGAALAGSVVGVGHGVEGRSGKTVVVVGW
jgi:hypothetical protein